MLTSQIANVVTFFYPLGNTPAVFLTQSLPPEKQADVLLLGSGDLRHVLFTIHTDARNILLLSLIIDDIDGTRNALNWNIYYHFRIDEISLQLLQSQARKLYALAVSLGTWHESKYGRLIKLCDHESLEKVREMWEFYGIERKGSELSRFEEHLDACVRKSNQHKARLGEGMNLTGLRSSCPAPLRSIADLDTMHKHYWQYGSTDLNRSTQSLVAHANPMFVSLDDNVVMHYGTDPLLGFHLATAYVPIAATPPLFLSPAGLSPQEHVVEAAKTEFRSWTTSFRNHAHSVGLRFFVGDALAFSHCLHKDCVTLQGADS